MATARTAQTHDKRVQKIADDAAAKIAADAPLEEEVVVVVEELPPGESTRTRRGSSTQTDQEPATAMFSILGQSQKLIADGISHWTELAAPFAAGNGGTELFGSLFDPRHMTREAFRLAEELVALQKEFTLKVVDAMSPARAV